jgi:hypothetical protein
MLLVARIVRMTSGRSGAGTRNKPSFFAHILLMTGEFLSGAPPTVYSEAR